MLIMLLFLVWSIVLAICLLEWIVRPIASLAQPSRRRTQFTVADLLTLFVMLQFTVGTIHYLFGGAKGEPGSTEVRDSAASALIVDAIVAGILLLSWWAGVVMASRAGINRWWHRAIGLGFVVPCAAISTLMAVFLSFFTMACLFMGRSQGIASLLGILSVLLAVVGVCGALTRWIAAKYDHHEVAVPPAPEQASQPHSTPVEE